MVSVAEKKEKSDMPAKGQSEQKQVCPVCSGSKLKTLFEKHGYPVVACEDCRLRFLDPKPDGATLAKIYNATYFLGEPTPEAVARVEKLKRATASLYVDRLVRFLKKKKGRILELGCGKGEFLVEAKARGFDVNGIEFSPDATAVANQRLGAQKVIAGTIENSTFGDGSFDAVVFADVIEHVNDPLDFLKRVYALLQPDGIVFLATPSLDSWSAKLLGRNWMEYKIEHLYYFNERSIRIALEKNNFGQVAIIPNVKVLSFDYITHHFQRYPVPFFTLLTRILRKLTPNSLANRHIQLVASGMIAVARK